MGGFDKDIIVYLEVLTPMIRYLEVLTPMIGYLEVLTTLIGYLEVLTPTATFPLTSLTNTERIAVAKSALLEK